MLDNLELKGSHVNALKWSLRARGLILIVSCLGLLFVVRGIRSFFKKSPHIELICDAQLSSDAAEKLAAWCKMHPQVSSNPQKLVDEFCWVKSCSVRYTRIGHASIRVVPHEAVAVLNNDHILVSNASVVLASYFVDRPIVEFTVNERVFTDRVQRTALVTSAHMMEPALFERYTFSWRDATVCMVKDKITGNTVVADNQTVINSKKIGIGMELAHSKCSADIRFDQQIVLLRQNAPSFTLGMQGK